MGFREEKLKMRRRLHAHMKVSALYLTDGSDYVGTPVTVRPHTKFLALGDQKGTSFSSAEMESIAPKIILWISELPDGAPRRNHIISIAPGEAYSIDHAEEPDGETITVHVTQLSQEEAKNLAVPENA